MYTCTYCTLIPLQTIYASFLQLRLVLCVRRVDSIITTYRTNTWRSRGGELRSLTSSMPRRIKSPSGRTPSIPASEPNTPSTRQPLISKLCVGNHSSNPLLGTLTFQQGRQFRLTVAQDVGPGVSREPESWRVWEPTNVRASAVPTNLMPSLRADSLIVSII